MKVKELSDWLISHIDRFPKIADGEIQIATWSKNKLFIIELHDIEAVALANPDTVRIYMEESEEVQE